jgi:hypothetical protein
MSNRVLNYVWDHSPSTGTELLVLLSLADQANDDGICWPSVRSLCRRSRIKRRHAQRIIAVLEARGEIEITRRKRPDKSYTSNVYRVIFPTAGAAVYGSDGSGPETTGGRSTDHGGGGLQTTRGSGLQTTGEWPTDREVVAHRPPQEPSFNPQMNREGEPLSQTPLSELVKAKSRTPKQGGDK